jgi:hypothetical protein
MLPATENHGMPHFRDDSASGAASSTSRRSSTRMARRCGGCFSKKASIGAPKSERLEVVFGAALFEVDRFGAGFLGLPEAITALPS